MKIDEIKKIISVLDDHAAETVEEYCTHEMTELWLPEEAENLRSIVDFLLEEREKLNQYAEDEFQRAEGKIALQQKLNEAELRAQAAEDVAHLFHSLFSSDRKCVIEPKHTCEEIEKRIEELKNEEKHGR